MSLRATDAVLTAAACWPRTPALLGPLLSTRLYVPHVVALRRRFMLSPIYLAAVGHSASIRPPRRTTRRVPDG